MKRACKLHLLDYAVKGQIKPFYTQFWCKHCQCVWNYCTCGSPQAEIISCGELISRIYQVMGLGGEGLDAD